MAHEEDEAESASRWWEFEQFVRAILERTPGISLPTDGDLLSRRARKDLGIDIEAVRDDRPLLVEIKSQTPQTAARLQDLTAQLRAAASHYEQVAKSSNGGEPTTPHERPALLAVFPGVLARAKAGIFHDKQIEVWDGRYLQRQARQFGIRAPSFVAVPEEEERLVDKQPATELAERLPRIRPGRTQAVAYEKWCEEALGFLFCPPLNPAIVQSPNGSMSNRRDLIMPNYATHGFFRFLRSYYGAAHVVAEVKNYGSPVGKNSVLQLANYLSRHGTGPFGMLLTRQGLNRGASWTQREHWVLHDKMIICLDDEDMKQMLLAKQAGNDPSELVQQRIEDFRLRI